MALDKNTITFQIATHYLPKVALKLESLYQTIYQSSEEKHPIIHHYALKNLIELLSIIEKPELKSRFLKEFMRIEHIFKMQESASQLFEELHHHIQILSHVIGRFGEGIYQDTFIQSIRSLHSTFDAEVYAPQLILWLQSPSKIRQEDIGLWLSHLHMLYQTVSLYLKCLRSQSVFEPIHMVRGFYQCPLPARGHCHLILLRMSAQNAAAPIMQIGHGLSIRLYEARTMKELKDEDCTIMLELAICQL